MNEPQAEHPNAAVAGTAAAESAGTAHGLADPDSFARLREAIRSINQRIFDTTIDLIFVVDSQGTFLRVSPSAQGILGYSPEEMIGRSAAEFLHPDDLEPTRQEMRLARRGQVTRHFNCRYRHRAGRLVTLAWTGVWSEPDAQHFFIGRDMTEHIKLENQLRQAQKMEAIGQLTGGIAHDFNNLLAVMVGSIELMLDVNGVPPAAREHAENAMHAAQAGAELTRRLLAFARQQPLEPRRVDANTLIGTIAALLQRTLGQHIEMVLSPAPDLSPILVDPANLESAIANLAVNARDAMPRGGRLTIETSNAALDETYAAANPGVEAGDYVSIAVTDTGTGMTADVLERIFEPFFTTKEQGKGTGLGLSMVFGFIKQSGGHIKAYSEIGHGTTIRLYLPRAQGAEIAAPEKPEVEPAASPQGHARLLVVEDSDAIRRVVLTQLSHLGYETLEADGPAAALRILDAGQPVDLLFTDIVMPGGMSGLDLAREAKKRRPDLKVLFTSGFPGAHFAGDGGAGNGHAVLSKPYRFKELAAKIRAALDE